MADLRFRVNFEYRFLALELRLDFYLKDLVERNVIMQCLYFIDCFHDVSEGVLEKVCWNESEHVLLPVKRKVVIVRVCELFNACTQRLLVYVPFGCFVDEFKLFGLLV